MMSLNACVGLLCGMLVLAWPVLGHGEPGKRVSKRNTQDESRDPLKNMQIGSLIFDFSGQVRARYEYDGGLTLLGYEPGGHDQLLLERVRLDLAARFKKGPRLFLQLQDAHAWLTRLKDSDFPVSSPIQDTLDIRQLYVEWEHIGGTAVGFRLGRQQISYGDQRVFGPGSWGNTGRYAWDAAMLKIDTRWFWTDAWVGDYLTYKSDIWPDRDLRRFRTFVAYTHLKELPFRLDVFYVLKSDTSGTVVGESGTGNLLSHTVGFQAEGHAFELLDASATFAAQFGRYANDLLRAYGASGKLGLTLPVAGKPRIGGQYTWGSGDANPADGVHGTFDGVYGGRDIYFYGYLNLFFWANLRDAEVDFSVKPHRGIELFIEYHHFRLDQATDAWYTTGLKAYRRDPTGGSGTGLGDELDSRVVWTLWNHLELMGGFGRFFPGNFVKNTGPAAPANWIFIQAAYSW
ncbi:MAG: alginate export family protein [Candidatus Aminicenantes bacterium]|nr:alginate export family protein [Candidatus Aminicenantes bacterium]